ncbi:unnamed protein product [Caenorhabditis angaria]|uniref:Protein kinase domain-containing protein n=1 Tax=Caenorhabditis angaria TaxID=860376 RepID=A0A9P1IIR2_9PELO|nr:unnamed protein product [Caenorhabditis angaria]
MGFYKFVESFEQRSDCVKYCEHLDTSGEFGNCLTSCSRTPRSDYYNDNLFASPPFDVQIETKIENVDGIMLETHFKWKADERDSRRTGFSIRYTALNETCQKNFPGFFTSSISSTERSFKIPAVFNGHSLIIDFLCTYQLQIRSIPYPSYNNNNNDYIIGVNHTVGECIGEYCMCKPEKMDEIKEIKIEEISKQNYELSWKIEKSANLSYSFYVDVFEEIESPLEKLRENHNKEKDYTYEIANEEPIKILEEESKIGESSTHKFILPFPFEPTKHYKIGIFGLSNKFCPTNEIFYFFNPISLNISVVEKIVENVEIEKKNATISNVLKTSAIQDRNNNIFLESTAFFVFFILVACMSPLCTAFILFLWKRRSSKKKLETRFLNRRSISCSRHSIMETNILYRSPQDINGAANAEWKIRGQDIAVGTVIGEGAFGLVFKGILRGPNGQVVRVAVKQLKANALDEEKEEFVHEIQMMQTVGQHENIVTMYGYCMDDSLQCMIMEYVPFGDLKHYLQNYRKELVSSNPEDTNDEKLGLDLNELQSFAQQIARGMAHLESRGIIHRDLAARNILVGTGKILKISDFGMSRPGVYVKTSRGVIPLRWLSPEAIKDNTYSSKSDVWAYGVLLWEIATLGGFPYNNIADKDIYAHLSEANRLEKPVKCSDEIYDLMKSCWAIDFNDRPSFFAICQHFDKKSDNSSIV